jgi:hypothetical protein
MGFIYRSALPHKFRSDYALAYLGGESRFSTVYNTDNRCDCGIFFILLFLSVQEYPRLRDIGPVLRQQNLSQCYAPGSDF